jgi:L-arabinose isomerase
MAGPTHHFALGVGHHAEELKMIADSFHLDSVVI